MASYTSPQHCNRPRDAPFRWGLGSTGTGVPQRPRYLGAASAQSAGRAAEDVRDGAPQQHFRAALTVLATALPAWLVWPVELREYSLISHADICRSFKPGSQAICYLGSSGFA